MKTKMLILVFGFVIAAGAAFAQPGNAPEAPMPMKHHQMMHHAGLKLTDQQKTQVEKIKFDLMKKQIDLRAQIAKDRVDYAELASAENPDRSALESKVDDMANLRSQLHKNMLDAWFDVNKVLTPEQQKLWKKALEHPMLFARHMGMKMMDGEKCMCMKGGMMMGKTGMMGRGGMMGSQGAMKERIQIMKYQHQPPSDSGK